MDDNRTLNEEIEESLRICEELLSQNPDLIPEKPQFLEELDQTERKNRNQRQIRSQFQNQYAGSYQKNQN